MLRFITEWFTYQNYQISNHRSRSFAGLWHQLLLSSVPALSLHWWTGKPIIIVNSEERMKKMNMMKRMFRKAKALSLYWRTGKTTIMVMTVMRMTSHCMMRSIRMRTKDFYDIDISMFQYRVEKEFSGRGYAPYDPTHNSTSLYTRWTIIHLIHKIN